MSSCNSAEQWLAQSPPSQWGSALEIAEAYLNQIHLLEGFVAPRLLDIENANDVLVVEVAQELHLSEGTQTEHGVVKRGDLFDGHFLARGFMYRRATQEERREWELAIRSRPQKTASARASDSPDNSIGALADDILDVVLLADIEGDLAGPGRVGRLGSRHVESVVGCDVREARKREMEGRGLLSGQQINCCSRQRVERAG